MNKVLITGSTGFIGCHLAALLLEKGYDVHCLVRYNSDISGLRDRALAAQHPAGHDEGFIFCQ